MAILIPFAPKQVLETLLTSSPSKAHKRRIASRLARRVHRKRPFSVGYLDNIVKGRQECSTRGELYFALRAVWAEEIGGNPIVGAYAQIELRAIPGRVEAHSLVLADSIHCAYLPCNISFVPRSSSQKYCCIDHRWANRRRDETRIR